MKKRPFLKYPDEEKVLLKQQNLRLTRQRTVILEELRKVYTHPNAEEVYEIVKKDIPRISLGTVYRNLEILSEVGEIQKLEVGGCVKRFDANPYNHYHIRCVQCDKIVDAPIGVKEDIEAALKGKTGFQIIGHRLEFLGICPECRGNIPEETSEI